MASKITEQQRNERIKALRARLQQLDKTPENEKERVRLRRELQLIRAETHAPAKKTADAIQSISKSLTPKSIEDSLGTITSLREFCKQCARYVQQADQVLDTLFVTTNSLKDSGVLKKLMESKGKNLDTSDFTNILMALMNSPLGATVFNRLGDGKKTDDPAPPAIDPPKQKPSRRSHTVRRPVKGSAAKRGRAASKKSSSVRKTSL
ncbi:hypothetical protein [Ferroacidibacillus organovorans]|uniref:Uncharacterized protein n=1 Tax=Ferroacidibacillus organovorans TaxID=1765683 RepID=A0A101XSB6_9BACL|nr:hypothetical protein [Ferroacidibacillus organovorans]KUO96611.1 hypothetical protein ATW55_00590 [Ferroacidibacillus organovorans]